MKQEAALSERYKASSIDRLNFRLVYPASQPDFWKLDKQDVFTLGEASALWLDQQPEREMRAEAREVFWGFHSDIYDKKLSTRLSLDESISMALDQSGSYPTDGEDPITVETTIGREELKRYAKVKGVKPMFLFKDMRAGKKPDVSR